MAQDNTNILEAIIKNASYDTLITLYGGLRTALWVEVHVGSNVTAITALQCAADSVTDQMNHLMAERVSNLKAVQG